MLKNLMVMLVSVLLSLLAGEAIVRLLYDSPAREMAGFRLSTSSYYRRDADLGWVPNPKVQGSHVLEGSFSTTFTTNSLGLRDKEYGERKPQGVTRIVVIGDSFTWGYGVNDEDIYVELLEKLLRDTEVINLGVTAYGLRQEINYLERLGLKLDPDIIIVGFSQNDVFASRSHGTVHRTLNMDPDTSAGTSEGVAAEPPSAFARIKRFLWAQVALYNLLVDAFNSSRRLVKLGVLLGLKEPLEAFEEMDPNIMPALRDYPPELRRSWQDTEDELREVKALANHRGLRLILAMVPALQSVEKGALERSLRYSQYDVEDFDPGKPYRQLLQFATAEGIEVVNPLERFRTESASGRSLYLPLDMHFNARGHAIFAEEIAAYMAKARQ